MKTILASLGILAAVTLGTPAHPQTDPPPRHRPADCPDVPKCLERLLAETNSDRQYEVMLRLVELGDPAAVALIGWLTDSDRDRRAAAEITLAQFESLDPRHLPTLLTANGDGDGSLLRAIAAVDTDQAAEFVWRKFLEKPGNGPHNQLFQALPKLGARLRPRLLRSLDACRTGENDELCGGSLVLIRELRDPLPEWVLAALIDLERDARFDGVRFSSEQELVRRRHPAGLAPVQRRLAAFSPDDALEDGRWQLTTLIDSLARYGDAARASGPLIARYLDRRFDEDLRADAALALGKIGDISSTNALLALAADFDEDWLLAYNAVESLGRLRATAARPLLERLGRDHWHRGVRNNASRALNMIAGGPFARPDLPEDGFAYPAPSDEEGDEYLYLGDLRYAGDDAARWCSAFDDEDSTAVPQDPVAVIAWPRHGDSTLEFESIGDSRRRDIRRRIPVRHVQGQVMAVLPVRSGLLTAFNGGEFGGGLYHLPDRGEARSLVGEPVVGAWLMGGRLYVAAGLSHLGLDRGHLYVVDTRRLRVERTIRLPASPWRLAVSSRRAVVIRTRQGHVAVGEDGRLIDPRRIGDCASDRSGGTGSTRG